jgi:Flp pilus assembly protein TadG
MSCSAKQFGRQRKPRRKGAALLEMLLVLPILLMLSFGVVDYGYYLYLKNTFQSAAEAGVRAAVPYAATNASVTGTNGIVTQMMSAGGFPAASYVVTLSPSNVSNLSPGTQITVTISALWGNVGTHALNSSFGGISDGKAVVGNAVMQKEAN